MEKNFSISLITIHIIAFVFFQIQCGIILCAPWCSLPCRSCVWWDYIDYKHTRETDVIPIPTFTTWRHVTLVVWHHASNRMMNAPWNRLFVTPFNLSKIDGFTNVCLNGFQLRTYCVYLFINIITYKKLFSSEVYKYGLYINCIPLKCDMNCIEALWNRRILPLIYRQNK